MDVTSEIRLQKEEKFCLAHPPLLFHLLSLMEAAPYGEAQIHLARD